MSIGNLALIALPLLLLEARDDVLALKQQQWDNHHWDADSNRDHQWVGWLLDTRFLYIEYVVADYKVLFTARGQHVDVVCALELVPLDLSSLLRIIVNCIRHELVWLLVHPEGWVETANEHDLASLWNLLNLNYDLVRVHQVPLVWHVLGLLLVVLDLEVARAGLPWDCLLLEGWLLL